MIGSGDVPVRRGLCWSQLRPEAGARSRRLAICKGAEVRNQDRYLVCQFEHGRRPCFLAHVVDHAVVGGCRESAPRASTAASASSLSSPLSPPKPGGCACLRRRAWTCAWKRVQDRRAGLNLELRTETRTGRHTSSVSYTASTAILRWTTYARENFPHPSNTVRAPRTQHPPPAPPHPHPHQRGGGAERDIRGSS